MIIKKGDKVKINDGLWKGKIGKVSWVASDCMVQIEGMGLYFFGKELTSIKKGRLNFPNLESQKGKVKREKAKEEI